MPPKSQPRALKRILRSATVIVGIGNVLRSDDAVGPWVVTRLMGRVRAHCIDAGTTPENHFGTILKHQARAVLLIDAAELGLEPGEWAVLTRHELAPTLASTHGIPLSWIMERIETSAGAAVYLLAVQPRSLEFGEGLSTAVERTADRLTRTILSAISDRNS